MAHQPAIRPDSSSFEPPDEPRNVASGEEAAEQDPSQVLAELARTLSQYGGGTSSADLAVDLVLHEIVQQACLATRATGAAVALIHGDELVVRATTGPNAPELGVRLSMQAGLSGACLQTGDAQLCTDSQSDARVDPLTCTELGIHSILAVPIAVERNILGIIEIFSNQPRAFGDRDEQTLRALSRRVVSTIQTAVQPPAVAEAVEPVEGKEAEPEPVPEEQVKIPFAAMPAIVYKRPRRDYATQVLTLLVIGAALLLGWMVGFSKWRSSEQRASESPATASTPAQAPERALAPVPAEPSPRSGEPAENRKIPSKAASDVTVPTGLVVYDRGKVIFQSGPQQPAAAKKPAVIPSAIAGGLLLSKVEPSYPEAAKEQNLEGPVVLKVLVADDGSVQEVNLQSGDPQLGDAAASAVRQWRFRPYQPRGKAVPFQTSVTVKFSLSGDDRAARNP